MRSLDELAGIAGAAAQLGHALMLSSRLTEVRQKGDRDTVTNVDLLIEEKVRAYLAAATPEIAVYSEELDGSTALDPGGPVWALDPIDGTANYTHGLPLCAVSLALIDNAEPVVAVIDAPFLDLRYTASKDNQAYAGGRVLRVSSTNELAKAIVAIGDYAVGPAATDKNVRRLKVTAALAGHVERIRMFGTAALDLAWLAEGRIDAVVMLSNRPWDTAAGILIAREAGALITDASGRLHRIESAETVASSPGIATALHSLVTEHVA